MSRQSIQRRSKNTSVSTKAFVIFFAGSRRRSCVRPLRTSPKTSLQDCEASDCRYGSLVVAVANRTTESSDSFPVYQRKLDRGYIRPRDYTSSLQCWRRPRRIVDAALVSAGCDSRAHMANQGIIDRSSEDIRAFVCLSFRPRYRSMRVVDYEWRVKTSGDHGILEGWAW